MRSSGRLQRVAEASTDKYRILADLGEGGMANVYLAVARGPGGFNKLLVLKAIREEHGLQPDLLAMFLDEARLAARLSHPNVVQTIEVSELHNRPVIVMEYLDGQPLSSILHRPECRDMPLAMRLRIFSAALEGLQYIHDLADFDGTPLQLVHRDVSPHNVFATFDGQVKLLDFGIAKGLISRARTSTDVIKGKIRYMAPEQMANEQVDRRADIFSAGVILWEIATGQRIWHGRSEVNVMHAVLNEGVPPPSTVEPSVGSRLNEICVRALGRAPSDRYQTAAEFQTDVEDYLERLGSRVTPKDVGKFLATAFAGTRARTKEVIDTELKKSEESAETSSGRFAFPATIVTLNDVTRSGSVDAATTLPSGRRGWAAMVAFVLVVSALVVAGVVLVQHRPSGANASTIASPVPRGPMDGVPIAASAIGTLQGAASSRSEKDSRTVHLELGTDPPGAALFLDGKRIENPFTGDYDADPSKHVVRADARGYATATADITLDSDLKLVLPLSPARTVTGPRRTPMPTGPAPAPPPVTTVSPSPTTNTCSPPFYFDAHGVKKYKPECL